MSFRRDRVGGGRTNLLGGGSRPSTSGSSRPSTPSTAGGNLDGSFERGKRKGESNIHGTSIPLPASIAKRISPAKNPDSPAPRPQTALSDRSSSAASMRSARSDRPPPRPHTAMAVSKPEGERREVHKSLQWSHPSPHRHNEADDNDGLSSRDTHSRGSSRQSSAASSRRRMMMRPVSAPPDAEVRAREDNEDGGSEADSRPQTSSSRLSKSVRGEEVDSGSWRGSQRDLDSDRRSDTSSIVEERLVDFQKSFQNKNAAKHALLSECFREVDTNKNGVVGREELKESMRKFDVEIDDAVIDRLMKRCADTDAMSMQEFKELLWVDQSMDSLFHRSQSVGAGGRGDNANARHLWAPAKTVNKFIGTINDTLEAERQATGPPPGPRLNLNFSSVRYDILTLGRGGHVDPSVRVPVKERKTIFDSPYPRGRRTAFDKGDTPFNILSLKSPRIPGLPVPVLPSVERNAPVRLHTFARIHCGEYPTQHGHMLTKSVV